MALFRDRRVFPRWSFIDSRTLPRPRYAKDDISAQSVPTPTDTPTEIASAPEVEVWREPREVTPPIVHAGEHDGSKVMPQRALLELPPVSWIEERRRWFAEDYWPTEASDEAVQLASTHPSRPYTAPLHPGLPTESPAEVRARHGRGFTSPSRRRRHRRLRQAHEQERARTDIDLVALDAALEAAAAAIGDGLVHAVVWHATTGFALASRGDVSPEVASAWHGAVRDVRDTLPHADLPDPGSYHLVGLAERRLAVLLHAGPDLGACVTVDLEVVAVDPLLSQTLPRLVDALAATSKAY